MSRISTGASRETRGGTEEEFISFADQLRRTVGARPEAEAVQFEGRRLSYRELFDRACRLANGLASMGVRPGDRVATLAPNRLETVEEICAIALLGAVRVPLYIHNTLHLHLHMLALAGAAALIVESSLWDELAPHRHELPDLRVVVVHGESTEHRYDELVRSSSEADPLVPSGPEDVAVIRFSSGTTGLPKGIMHRQAAYAGVGEAMAGTMEEVTPDSVQIVAGPMSHVSGIFFWPVIARGAKQIVMPRFDPERFVAHIEDGGTFSLVVPTMLRSVLELPGLRDRSLRSLRRLGYGGAPIDESTLRRALDVFGPIFTQSFGQSEVCPISALPSALHDLSRPGADLRLLRSAGFPVDGVSIRIVDDQGGDVAQGTVGEVAVKAAWTMSEIWGDPEATAARFLPDGHLLTRDMGYLDDGVLYLADRKDDMIISGGYNIWPTELENALLEHPEVAEAAVVGVPHEKWGETPLGVVTLRLGSQVSGDELVAWCRERVGSVKKPSRVIVRLEPLPRNGTGKLLRRILREDYAGEFWDPEPER